MLRDLLDFSEYFKKNFSLDITITLDFISFCIIHFQQQAREFVYFKKYEKLTAISQTAIFGMFSFKECSLKAMILRDLSIFMIYTILMISWDLRVKKLKKKKKKNVY